MCLLSIDKFEIWQRLACVFGLDEHPVKRMFANKFKV